MRLFADTPSRGLPPSSTAAPAAAASAPTHATGTSGTGRRGRLGSFGSVVHKERVEVEAVGQYPRPDGIAADREGAVRDWVLPPHGNLGLAQVGVHCGIDPDDGPVDDSAVLELDGHGLPVQLLQKLDQLHGVFPFELERASRTNFLVVYGLITIRSTTLRAFSATQIGLKSQQVPLAAKTFCAFQSYS